MRTPSQNFPRVNGPYEKVITMRSVPRRSPLSVGVVVVTTAAAMLGTSLLSSPPPHAGASPVLATAPGLAVPTATGVDTLTWQMCPADSPEDVSHGLPRADVLCATVSIPVDHLDPGGRAVEVEVRRITSLQPRAGAVFGNPGGPGADARTLWYSAIDADQNSPMDTLRQTNDLVIVQPRGLEGAGALECLPDGAGDRSDEEVAKACMDVDPELVSSITTENLVRDHEYVRQAMGLGRIIYIGYSYGTAIGMMYQTLFPASIERMVLDSSVGPTENWWYDLHRLQAENRYQARNYVLGWIANNDATYGLGDTPLKVYRKIHELDMAEGNKAARFLPPPAVPGDEVVGSLAVGSAGASSAPVVAGSVDALTTGSARLDNAAAASSGAFDEEVDGAVGYFRVLDINSRTPSAWSEIAWVISGAIHGTLPDPPTPEELEEQLEEEAPVPAVTSDQAAYLTILNCNETVPSGNLLAGPLLGSADAVGSTSEDMWALETQTRACLYPPSAVPPKIEANEMVAPPLILQSDHDPNTPGQLGQPTAIATGGTLVRIKGTVHCHFDTGNDAVDAVVLDYLNTGSAPEGLYLDTPVPVPGPAPWVGPEAP